MSSSAYTVSKRTLDVCYMAVQRDRIDYLEHRLIRAWRPEANIQHNLKVLARVAVSVYFPAQRARAASLAISVRRSGVSLDARAAPPFARLGLETGFLGFRLLAGLGICRPILQQ